MEAIIVYGLVVLFFLAILGLVFFVIAPNNQQLVEQGQMDVRAHLDGQQSNVLNYGIVAALFLLLIVFTLITRKQQVG